MATFRVVRRFGESQGLRVLLGAARPGARSAACTPSPIHRIGFGMDRAEGRGFEPPIRLTTDNGFRDRRIRPLCHPSAGARDRGVALTEKEGFEPSMEPF